MEGQVPSSRREGTREVRNDCREKKRVVTTTVVHTSGVRMICHCYRPLYRKGSSTVCQRIDVTQERGTGVEGVVIQEVKSSGEDRCGTKRE